MQLFSEFSPISPTQWLDQMRKDLKDKPLDALDWKPETGLSIPPYAYLWTKKEGEQEDILPNRRGNLFQTMDRGWQMVQEVQVDSKNAKAEIKQALAAEVNAFALVSEKSEIAHFTKAISLLNPAKHAIHVYFQGTNTRFMEAMHELFEEKGWDSKNLTGTFYRTLPHSTINTFSFSKNAAAFPYFRTLGITVEGYDASIITQLAVACTKAIDIWDELTEKKLTLAQILPQMAFQFPISSNFLLETAKLRAFRKMYARVCEAYGMTDEKLTSPFILSATSKDNKFSYDAHNNILRAATEGISAILSGTNALTIRPFDATFEESDLFSHRIARNIQHLLKEEAYLDKVTDAVGGSYYIENLTDYLAEKAWTYLQEIEQKGGFHSAESVINAQYQAELDKQKAAVRTRKKNFVGINNYPNAEEFHTNATAPSSTNLATDFEVIRNKIDALSQLKGKRLQVNILSFGEPIMANARALFARNLIACGGFVISENETALAGSDAIVICSSDEDYFTQSAAIIQQIKTHNPSAVLILAGKPENWQSLGADMNIYAGMDVITFLENLLGRMLLTN